MIKTCLFILLFLGLLFMACKNSDPKHIVTIKQGTTIIKGDINGSILNDTIRYYNLADELIRKSYFRNGKQEGTSIDFYRNGLPKVMTHFSDGLKNGYNSYCDSAGKCYYRDFYYYGLSVGPIEYLTNGQIPKRFFFISLENETLLDINYNDWKGVRDILTKCINFKSEFQRVDTTHEITVLLYLIAPPRLSFDYSILKKKKDSGVNFQEIQKVKSDLPFVNIALPILPTDEQYTIGLSIYDSILNKRTVVYKDL
jgi:hypothetical protein